MKLPGLLLAIAVPFLCAEDAPRATHPWKVRAELQVVTLPEKTALALLPELRDDAKIEGACKQIATLLGKGEAKLTAALVATVNDGGKGESAQGDEIIYPTEFAQPQIVEADPKPGAPPQPKENAAAVTIAPTSFDARNVGVKLTLGAATSPDGQVLELDATAEHVWHLGWEEFEAGQTLRGDKLKVRQPRFSTARTESHITLRSGGRVLLSIHRIPSEPGRMELFILQADSAPLPKK